MAHKITDKVINPVSIEKTNVHLADACFHNSTINALRYYAKNGYPHFTETADVLQIMRNWWDIMNVKSLFTGQQSINCKRCPLYKDSCAASLAYLGSMVSWIKGWHSLNPQHGLSKETRLALQHTTSTIIELVKHLFKVETDMRIYFIRANTIRLH